jgi:pyruvate formate lyase activating enzyme
MRAASFQESLPGGRVRCTLCPHECRIPGGAAGACGVRVNRRGTLYTLVDDRVVARHVDPIEKKPLFHFMPGSSTYSIATVGCCLHCAFCQNREISQWPAGRAIPGERVTPAVIVDAALAAGCASIAYTYTEPTVFFELALDTAALARRRGLRNVFVTSGFIGEAALRRIAPVLDGVNVDLKFFRDGSYRRVCRARLAPVLEAIRLYHELGVWTEVTTLLIPGLNDSDGELRDIAGFVRSIGAEVPWHVSRFHPAWRMSDRPATPIATLRRARAIGLEAGLRHVYEGNVPGGGGESTFCWACGATVIERRGFALWSNRVRDGGCPDCGTRLDGVGMEGAVA